MSAVDAIRFEAATDVGRVREHNEDNFLVDKKIGLFIVADGMGGHAAGEVASAIAVRTVHEELKQEKSLLTSFATGTSSVTNKDILSLLEHAFQCASAKVHEGSLADPLKRGMGTTLSGILILGHHAFVAHVGDSRIYMQRGERIFQVTEDHTVFNELMHRGKLSRAEIAKVAHKNAITRAVGVYERVEVDTVVIEIVEGDTFVLASDGLTGYLESPDVLRDYLLLEGEAKGAAKSLVAFANVHGGKDNITTVIVRIGAITPHEIVRAQRLKLKREVLGNMPLFAHLSEREIISVMQAAEVRLFSNGDVILREGDDGEELFIILSGSVTVTRGNANLSSLGQGEHFGEMALIRKSPRSATVKAQGDAELIVIHRTAFFDLIRKERDIAIRVLWQFLGVFADRLDQTSGELRQARSKFVNDDLNDLFDDGPEKKPTYSREEIEVELGAVLEKLNEVT